MTDQPPIKVRSTVDPIPEREHDAHVGFHHDRVVVMGGVVAPRGIDDRAMPHEPIVTDVAKKVQNLVE